MPLCRNSSELPTESARNRTKSKERTAYLRRFEQEKAREKQAVLMGDNSKFESFARCVFALSLKICQQLPSRSLQLKSSQEMLSSARFLLCGGISSQWGTNFSSGLLSPGRYDPNRDLRNRDGLSCALMTTKRSCWMGVGCEKVRDELLAQSENCRRKRSFKNNIVTFWQLNSSGYSERMSWCLVLLFDTDLVPVNFNLYRRHSNFNWSYFVGTVLGLSL